MEQIYKLVDNRAVLIEQHCLTWVEVEERARIWRTKMDIRSSKKRIAIPTAISMWNWNPSDRKILAG